MGASTNGGTGAAVTSSNGGTWAVAVSSKLSNNSHDLMLGFEL